MPFVLTVLVLAVAVSLARGGRPSQLGSAPLRWPWVLVLGLGVQVLTSALTDRAILTDASPAIGYTISQLALLTFAGVNLHHPGMPLIGLGLLLNGTVMVLNGGMPVDATALRTLGIAPPEVLTSARHLVASGSTRLSWLGDTLPLPWLRSVVSPGDLVLAAGLLPFVHGQLLGRPAPTGTATDEPSALDG